MLEDPLKLRPQQTAQLAQLHVSCLPDTAIGTLGRRYAIGVYRYLIHSRIEHVFLEHEAGQIIAAAVASEDPIGLFARLCSQTSLLWHVMTGAPTYRRWRAFNMLTEGSTLPLSVQGHPELVFLFTSAARRRRGIARRLLAKNELLLRSRGHQRYFVRTRNHKANQASHFYACSGLTLEISKNGIQYWTKSLE